jgi:hypothetical protein
MRDIPDTAIDWVVLRAGWSGLDVSRPAAELAAALGVPGWYSNVPIARPPGFFIAYWPLLSTSTMAVWSMVFLNAAGLGVLVHAARRMWNLGVVASMAVGFGCLALAAESAAWVNPSLLMSGLIVLTWHRIDAKWFWGVPLGVASAVRLWPLLVVVWLVLRRKPTGWGALAVVGALTVGGLAVIPAEMAFANLVGGSVWAGSHLMNLSISWPLRHLIPVAAIILVGSTLTLWAARKIDVQIGYGVVIAAAVVLSPIGWPAYLTATAPLWPILIRRRLTLRQGPERGEPSPLPPSRDRATPNVGRGHPLRGRSITE